MKGLEGGQRYKKSMNDKARSFVTIMIVIAISALLLRFGLGALISYTISQNESYASVTLKLVAAALENYAKDNQGFYPTSVSALTSARPAYLDKNYTLQSPQKGYSYMCVRLESTGYTCIAAPLHCKLTGNTIYTITTGNVLVSESCDLKES